MYLFELSFPFRFDGRCASPVFHRVIVFENFLSVFYFRLHICWGLERPKSRFNTIGADTFSMDLLTWSIMLSRGNGTIQFSLPPDLSFLLFSNGELTRICGHGRSSQEEFGLKSNEGWKYGANERSQMWSIIFQTFRKIVLLAQRMDLQWYPERTDFRRYTRFLW